MQQIAQVLKSNGTDGELVMSFREIAPEDINLKEPVFIVFDGLPVPFFIESLVKRGNSKALVHLTGIKNQEDVEEIAGKAVYIEDDILPELSLEEDGFAALVGWTLLMPAEIPDQVGDDEETVEDDQSEVGDDEEAVEDDQSEVGDDEEAVEDDEETVGEDEHGWEGEKASLPALTGNLYVVGEITEYIDIPNNPCIEVESDLDGAVMIPLHQDLILSVDPEYQEIIMQIPAGLL
ncbi:MAG: hypothetical protein IJB38_06305 [Bacteroidales bacterium]|nr:hypothetical protein [Bacteroidales bacterium]